MDGFILPMYRTTAHYLEQVWAAGGIPLQLPLLEGAAPEDIAALLARCDGLLLPGGGDFAPDWYGQTLLPNLKPDPHAPNRECQKAAIGLVQAAAAAGKPMLGICLGLQVINIALGGTLYQDIPTQLQTTLCHSAAAQVLEDRWKPAHTVQPVPGSLLARLCGTGSMEVNSFHHQAIERPAPGLLVTARAPDGVVEALEQPGGRILGVQWHPENMAHAGMPQARALFRWLVEAAAEEMAD